VAITNVGIVLLSAHDAVLCDLQVVTQSRMLILVVAVAVAASVSAAVPHDQIVALNDLFTNTSGKGWGVLLQLGRW
jgi:hypothetical protein